MAFRTVDAATQGELGAKPTKVSVVGLRFQIRVSVDWLERVWDGREFLAGLFLYFLR